MRGERENWKAGLQDRGERFHSVGDARDDHVGVSGEDFAGVGGPTVVEDVRIVSGQVGKSFETVTRAGAEMVETVKSGEGDGDRRLERSYTHLDSSIVAWRTAHDVRLL